MDTFRKQYQEIEAEARSNKVVRAFGELKKNLNGRPLALYGLVLRFDYFLSLCQNFGLPVACICDSNRKGVYKNGSPILDMPTLARDFRDAVVFICSNRYSDEIGKSLIQSGFAPESIVCCPEMHSWPWKTHLDFEPFLKGYEWAYNFFEDQHSRELIMDRVKLYLLGPRQCPNTASDMYYEGGFISLSQGEIFVDCGVLDGDTVIQFIDKMKAAGKTYKKIYGFEPSEPNRAAAIGNLSSHSNVEILPVGVWNSETELTFVDDLAGMSHMSHYVSLYNSEWLLFKSTETKYERVVKVTSLDMFFGKEKRELPTFIKMDIEGSEKEALMGAANIIKQAKPKLSICAYHKPEDIYELPQTIMGIRDDYRFALRSHPISPNEIILYAV